MSFFSYPKGLVLKTVAILSTILICQFNVNAQKRPNVIFILSDDVGYDLLSVNGSKSYSTPNIDSMAHNGINFTHCEGTPLCSPSRCMLLTGKYNFRNYSNWGYMNDSEKTFGNVMQDAGYKTAFFGKLQLPFSYSAMANWGFDSYTVFGLTEDTLEMRRYKSPTLIDKLGRIPDSAVKNKYCDDVLTSRMFDFIDNNTNNPFFIFYSMSLSHAPWSPTPNDSAYAKWNPNSGESDTGFFHSMIEYMDFEVGKILKKLASSGLDKNTIVIFSGDNGTPDEIHYDVDSLTNVSGAKSNSIEIGTHVPLVAYWPSKIKSGLVNDDLIDFSDFLPTFAQAAHITDLSKYRSLDGLSFYNRMLGIEDTAKQQLFLHFNGHPGFDVFKRWVRDKVYKLYDTANGSKFYNIVTDGRERHPLADSSLTEDEIAIKAKFQHILDTIATWPIAPLINNPYAINITESSATIGATIVNSGPSTLIDRGSTIIKKGGDFPTLEHGRKRDNTVALGTFSESRNNLKSETFYAYSLYAMNADTSHSTAFAIDSFYTLSNSPVSQPTLFKATADKCSVFLTWSQARFPSSGATVGGYAVYYATDSVQLIENPNGIGPSKITKNATLLPLINKTLPGIPDTILNISDLDKNIEYHFLLIPYTWNGTTNSTRNYLFQNARSVAIKPSAYQLLLSSTSKDPICNKDSNGNIIAEASNGTSPYTYSLNSGIYTSDSVFANLAAGNYLLTVKDAQGCSDTQSVVLISPEKLKLDFSIKNADCLPDGKIAASVENGIPPYMFSLNNGDFDTASHFINLSKGSYLIAAKDSNKCFTSSNAVVKSTAQNCVTGINILPNPSSSVFQLTIGSDQISSVIKLKVYSALGRLVYSDRGTQKSAYTFGSSFIKGVYFIEVDVDSSIYKFKIIKD